MVDAVSELFVDGGRYWQGFGTCARYQALLWHIGNVCNKRSVAMAKVANGIAHHDPDGSSNLQRLQNKIETLMDQMVGQETLHTQLVVDERRHWQKGKEEEAVKRTFAADICVDGSLKRKQDMFNLADEGSISNKTSMEICAHQLQGEKTIDCHHTQPRP